MIKLTYSILLGKALAEMLRSTIEDVVMPPVTLLLPQEVDISNNMYLSLKNGRKNEFTGGIYKYKSLLHAHEDGAVTMNFGIFLNSLTNFVCLALTVFAFIRVILKLKEKTTQDSPTTKQKSDKSMKCRFCKSKISWKATRCPYCRSFEPKPINGEAEAEETSFIVKNKFATLKKNLKKQLKQTAVLQGGFIL